MKEFVANKTPAKPGCHFVEQVLFCVFLKKGLFKSGKMCIIERVIPVTEL